MVNQVQNRDVQPALAAGWWLAAAAAAIAVVVAGAGAAAAQAETRHISDQEHAWMQRRDGQSRSFEELLVRAGQVGRGQYIGVEPDISRNVYRFKFRRDNGIVVWVDMDGRTGDRLEVRQAK